jgi:hypothetical protein
MKDRKWLVILGHHHYDSDERKESVHEFGSLEAANIFASNYPQKTVERSVRVLYIAKTM